MNNARTLAPHLPGNRALALRGLVLTLVLIALAGRASAAIELLFFRGLAETSRSKLEWQTATELNNAGFRILRSTSGGLDPAAYTLIEVFDPTFNTAITFIPARGDNLAGALYTVYDENVTQGTRYYYLLQDIDTSNNSSYHGPIEIVGEQTATPSASVTPTATGTALTFPTATRTPTPGPTRTPTELPPSTRRPSATATTTPAGSLTPSPTLTPTGIPLTQIPAVDQTLTAIPLELTVLATGTDPAAAGTPDPTATPLAFPEVSQAEAGPGEETGLEEQPVSAGQSGAADEGEPPPLPTGRIVLVILVVLVSGALLTGGVIFLARKSEDEAQQ